VRLEGQHVDNLTAAEVELFEHLLDSALDLEELSLVVFLGR
jgi:hypothetical protein